MTFDHELKYRRALEHLQDLDLASREWLEGEPYTVRREYDPDARWDGPIPPGNPNPADATYYLAGPVYVGTGNRVPPTNLTFGQGTFTMFVTAEQPPTDPLGLLIGDTLHNLRSSLDTLAYALATAHTDPLPDELASSSEFPIIGDEHRDGTTGTGHDDFRRAVRRGPKAGEPAPGSGLHKIRGWHPDAQAIVERLQPYKRGNQFRLDPLWVLHELDRISKHRLLHTAVAESAGSALHVPGDLHERGPRNLHCIGPGLIRSYGGMVQTDTPMLRIWGVHPIDPDSEVYVDVEPALHVAFAAAIPGVAGEPVVGTLAGLCAFVDANVFQPLGRFLN